MAGIFGFFTKKNNIKSGVKFFSEFENTYNDYKFDKGIVGRKVINKLKKDRFLETQKKITICFEGVNLSDTLINSDLIFKAYKEVGLEVVKNLKGSFSGFILDEEKKKISVFTDNLATKSIYYYFDKEVGFAFASELQALTRFFREVKIPHTLNRDAVYMMALYGFMMDDITYASEVKRLQYGSIVSYDYDKKVLDVEKYYEISSDKMDISYNDAIDTVERLITKSIRKNWGKSKEYENSYLTLLSGGMDARMNSMIAKRMGFKDIKSITFGQSKSKDVIYAKSIAIGEGFNHFTRFLDSGNYLTKNIYDYVKLNDGMVMYHSSAHLSSTLESFNLESYNLIHSGQIGSSLSASLLREDFDFEKNRSSIGLTGFVKAPDLLDKITVLPSLLKKYQKLGWQIYYYDQYEINMTIMGDRSSANIIDSVSPFYDKELLDFCIAIPNKYLKNGRLYFDWLRKYHPETLKYPYDKINMTPNYRFKLFFGRLIKKYFNGAKKYFNLNYESMNPYAVWFRKNKNFSNSFKKILEEELNREFVDKELKTDLLRIYNADIFAYRNKFAVITALLAMKLHFPKD